MVGKSLEPPGPVGLSLKKWGTELSWERNFDGSPKYKDLSPIYDQASACGRVSNLIKGLLAADIFASR